MRNTLAIAGNVLKDAVRKRYFYIVFVFGLIILALSPLLPNYELGSTAEFLRDVSISLTSLFGVLLAAILSVTQLSNEIRHRTIYNILSKPVSRSEYLLGSYLGLLATIFLILLIMGVEILVLLLFEVEVFTPVIFQGVFMVFLECMVISAFCLMLSTFLSVPTNYFVTVFFYFLCHVKTGFLYEKLVEPGAAWIKVLSWPLYYIIPNLENFSVSQQVGYGGGLGGTYILRTSAYAVLFSAIFMIVAALVFRKRDL